MANYKIEELDIIGNGGKTGYISPINDDANCIIYNHCRNEIIDEAKAASLVGKEKMEGIVCGSYMLSVSSVVSYDITDPVSYKDWVIEKIRISRKEEVLKIEDFDFYGEGAIVYHYNGKFGDGISILMDNHTLQYFLNSIGSKKITEVIDCRSVYTLDGEYRKSRKGLDLFDIRADIAIHTFMRASWGGPFENTRGEVKDGVLPVYFSRVSSSGGGLGVTYAVFHKDDVTKFKNVEDLL